jgi:hypothetical protein
MTGELAVLKLLLSDATVTGIVGQGIYMDEAPQGKSLPYIVIEEEGIEPFPTKSGASSKDHDSVRVYIYSSDQNTLRLLYGAARSALDEYSGTVTTGDEETGIVTINIDHIMFQGQTSFEEKINNKAVFVKDQDYKVRVAV